MQIWKTFYNKRNECTAQVIRYDSGVVGVLYETRQGTSGDAIRYPDGTFVYDHANLPVYLKALIRRAYNWIDSNPVDYVPAWSKKYTIKTESGEWSITYGSNVMIYFDPVNVLYSYWSRAMHITDDYSFPVRIDNIYGKTPRESLGKLYRAMRLAKIN